MTLLGGSQVRTAMDIYSQVMPALAHEAADRMGGWSPWHRSRDGSGRPPEQNGLLTSRLGRQPGTLTWALELR